MKANGVVILNLLRERVKRFGPITEANTDEAAEWLRRRVRELEGGRERQAFDPGKAAANDRE